MLQRGAELRSQSCEKIRTSKPCDADLPHPQALTGGMQSDSGPRCSRRCTNTCSSPSVQNGFTLLMLSIRSSPDLCRVWNMSRRFWKSAYWHKPNAYEGCEKWNSMCSTTAQCLNQFSCYHRCTLTNQGSDVHFLFSYMMLKKHFNVHTNWPFKWLFFWGWGKLVGSIKNTVWGWFYLCFFVVYCQAGEDGEKRISILLFQRRNQA